MFSSNITTLSNFYRLIYICVFAFIGNQPVLWRNQLLKLIKNLMIKIQSILFIHPYCPQSGPEVIKLFTLNSAEYEIFSANKYENANNSWHFHI